MAEHPVTVEAVRFRRMFPWLHLFRTFWIAADLRKLVLAGLALLLISAGEWAFDQLPFAPQTSHVSVAIELDGPPVLSPGGVRITPPIVPPAVQPSKSRWPWDQNLGFVVWQGDGALGLARGVLANPWQTLDNVVSNWPVVLRPMTALLASPLALLQPQASWSDRAYHVTRFLWSLCVWSIFGGAITRMAAVQFARDQQVGLWVALKFSSRRFLDYISAPLLPLGAVVLLATLCALGSLLGKIPGAGEYIIGIFWGVSLLISFLMALILIGIGTGWPLMFATISVEASDGFDGLSRAYNYVFERPWLYLWSIVVAMCYGSLVIFFVWFVGQFVIELSQWGAAWSLGADGAQSLFSDPPELFRTQRSSITAPPGAYPHGARLVGAWLCGLALLVMGFVHSYFWTTVTVIYYILRHSADGNDFDEVHLDDGSEPDDLLPLVGEAAMAAQAAEAAAAAAPPAARPVDLTP